MRDTNRPECEEAGQRSFSLRRSYPSCFAAFGYFSTPAALGVRPTQGVTPKQGNVRNPLRQPTAQDEPPQASRWRHQCLSQAEENYSSSSPILRLSSLTRRNLSSRRSLLRTL